MENTTVIDKKITAHLPHLSLKQKKAVLNVIETFANEFDVEMEKRFAEYENGTIKGYTINQTITAARKAFKAKQNK